MFTSLIGTFRVFAEGVWENAQLVRASDGTLDVVSVVGGESYGSLSTLRIQTIMKSGAAVRRLISAGRIKNGRENNLPEAWVQSAAKSEYTGFGSFLASRYGDQGWVTNQIQLDKGRALMAEVAIIEAAEAQAVQQ